jgi:hypothetical protein
MIQGLHASSVVFADFRAVSFDLLAGLRRQLPGIDSAGHPVRLRADDYKLRLGQVHHERSELVAHLHLESERVPFQTQMSGTVRLREDPKRSQTRVTFEGSCARNFGGLSSEAPTEAVRLLANDSSRALLDLLVTAIEKSSPVASPHSAIASSKRKGSLRERS